MFGVVFLCVVVFGSEVDVFVVFCFVFSGVGLTPVPSTNQAPCPPDVTTKRKNRTTNDHLN